MNKLRWTKVKPKNWKECLLITGTWMNCTHPGYWDYKFFTIKKEIGEDNEGNAGWYWAIFKDDEEWGDLADLKADKYAIVSPLKNLSNGK